MNPFRRFLPPAVLMLFVAACSGPEIAFDDELPGSTAELQGHLRWENPEILDDITASVGTPSGEFELLRGTALFEGSTATTGGYAVSFWAVHGEDRYVKLALDGLPVVTFEVPAKALSVRPDGTKISGGDSVLITMEVDETDLMVRMSPSGLQFNEKLPAVLSMWYDVAGKDFNNDGVVDKYDAYIETNLLGMWYRQTEQDDWSAVESTKVGSERSVSAPIRHFSGYTVSW